MLENKEEKEKQQAPLLLVVDDDRTMLMSLETQLLKQGYRVITAINGGNACNMIEKHHEELDAILLDRMMPDMDGIEVVKWLDGKTSITKVPVIMQTGSDRPEQIKEGIDAGVFYYLIKPISADVLKSVVSSAVRESKQKKMLRQERERYRLSYNLVNECKFRLFNLNEAEQLSCFLANMFPKPDYIIPGILELMTNAIEHGKCRITYEDKGKLVAHGKWKQEVERRCSLAQLKDLPVDVLFSRSSGNYVLKISDPGNGFPWHKYLHVDPARAMDNHGRGIARANMIFNKLQYNRAGNEVIAHLDISVSKDIAW